jgi:hypothetical protein
MFFCFDFFHFFLNLVFGVGVVVGVVAEEVEEEEE